VFGDPERTAYDLRFRCLGFPVRVHPLFWLAAALLGGSFLQAGLTYWLLWIAVVFGAVLVHELGHALAYRYYGSAAAIILWMFGGLTLADRAPYRRGARIVVTLAGPFAGFALAALLYGLARLTPWPVRGVPRELAFTYHLLIVVNLYWGIFNLLPVYPLDGGQVCREVCEGWRAGTGRYLSLQISLWTASLLALYGLLGWWEEMRGGGPLSRTLPPWVPLGSWWTALLFGLLAWQSYQLLQQERYRRW
jgi:Zn-dependent protease